MAFDKIKYNNDYNRENYCRLNILIPKTLKLPMETHYKDNGYKSLNAYINALIVRDMESNNKSPVNQKIEINGGNIGNVDTMHITNN